MKISFLVTYYQQKQYIAQSMEALLALKKPEEWEILIGDDGSSDGSIELAQSYVDRDPEHIRLYIMDRDPGKKYNSVERASLKETSLYDLAVLCGLDAPREFMQRFIDYEREVVRL